MAANPPFLVSQMNHSTGSLSLIDTSGKAMVGLHPPYLDQPRKLRVGKAEVLRALITLDANGDGALQIGEVRLATARTDEATLGGGAGSADPCGLNQPNQHSALPVLALCHGGKVGGCRRGR